jgi:hypothetical protein
MQRYVAALAFALASSAAGAARAQPEAAPTPARVHLSSSYGPGAQRCASASELRAAVETRLGRSVFVPIEAADLIAQVRAFKRGRELVVDVHLFDKNQRRLGERRLTTRARHCSALDDSLALVLALAADVSRESLGVEAAAASPAPPPQPQPLATPLDVPATTLAPREEARVRLGLGPSAAAGIIPSTSLGVHAAIEVAVPSFWPLRLGAALWRDRKLGAERGVEFSLQTLQLAVCPLSLDLGGLDLNVCAEQLLGRTHTVGFGFDVPDTSDHWIAAFGPGAQLRYWIGSGFVSLQGSLLVHAVRRRYYFEEGAEFTLHEGSWVVGLGNITAGFEL